MLAFKVVYNSHLHKSFEALESRSGGSKDASRREVGSRVGLGRRPTLLCRRLVIALTLDSL